MTTQEFITSVESRVYVGTYHKYNCGSIAGKWFALSDYSDFAEFECACLAFHGDEEDPELMPQDWEGLGSVSECGVMERVRLVYQWAELGLNPSDEDQTAAFFAFLNNSSCSIDAEAFQKFGDAFLGWWDSYRDFAEEQLEQDPRYQEASEFMQYHFDFESYQRDLEIGGGYWSEEIDGRVVVFISI